MAMRDRNSYLNKTSWPGGGKNGHRPNASEHHSFARRPQSSGSGKRWLLLVALVIVLFRVGNDASQHKPSPLPSPQTQADEVIKETREEDSVELIAGGLIIKADPTGHFRGKALIDHVEMPFLIDTGATQTAIPQAMANKAGLPVGRSIQTNTAGGQVNNQLTRMSSMKLGNAELKNLQAIINPHLTEVLIGMNTLKYFRMTQNKDTLTLVASNDVEPVETLERDLPLQMPPPSFMAEVPGQSASETTEDRSTKPATHWKKTLSCGSGNRCAPSYSAQ